MQLLAATFYCLNGHEVNLQDFLLVNRCVICQMEYRRGNLQMTLPCKHVYHASCVTRWLSINKVSNQKFTRCISAFVFLCRAALAQRGRTSFAGMPCLLCWSSRRRARQEMSYVATTKLLRSEAHRAPTDAWSLFQAARSPLFRFVY
jgi:hypothetical protein